MGYFDKFEAQENKLAELLADENLLHVFRTDCYPLSLTVSQNQAPDAQMSLYAQSDDAVSSRDAKLVLTFPVGEIGVYVYGRLVISDALMNKIKNHGKKMRDLWLQANHATNYLPERRPVNYDAEPVGCADAACFDGFYEDDTAPEESPE